MRPIGGRRVKPAARLGQSRDRILEPRDRDRSQSRSAEPEEHRGTDTHIECPVGREGHRFLSEIHASASWPVPGPGRNRRRKCSAIRPSPNNFGETARLDLRHRVQIALTICLLRIDRAAVVGCAALINSIGPFAEHFAMEAIGHDRGALYRPGARS
jgi:hypothetical protein